jgi:hypothetical protein
MTVDEIIDVCARSRADDWAFWVYLCGEAGAGGRASRRLARVPEPDCPSCARAVYLGQRAIGLVWSPASEDETASLTASAFAGRDCLCSWVGLLYDGDVVARHLAVWVGGAHAPLPAPLVEQRGDGSRPTLWVSRRAHGLVRLASEVDPDCGDFDGSFAASGIELR